MKRILGTCLILFAVILCVMLIPFGAKADTTADGLQYEISEGEITITGYTGSAAEVIIPETIEDCPVTGIGFGAFWGCSSLTNVTISDSVTYVEQEAFSECTGLTSVTIGKSIQWIGPDAFSCCDKLTSVYISDVAAWCNINFGWYTGNPLYYAGKLYLNGKLVTDLVIPDGVTTIDANTFINCSDLRSVSIPESITCVGRAGGYAFRDGNNLKYNIYENGKYLGNSDNPYLVFVESTSTDITACQLHPNTKVIGAYAFSNCTNLKDITIPNGVITIGDFSFASCRSLNSITIPFKVANIGYNAFGYCSSLTEIRFEGFAPKMEEYMEDCFSEITATAYYPAGNNTWTEDVLQDYGGNITWVPYEAYAPGDLDGVEGVDNRDVEYLLWYTLFPEDYPLLQRADFDGDGYVDNKDVECLLWHTLFPETYPL